MAKNNVLEARGIIVREQGNGFFLVELNEPAHTYVESGRITSRRII